MENNGNVPIVGICQAWPVWFGIGHTGPNGLQLSLATGATWSFSGAGSLDPGLPSDPAKRIFRAGSGSGSATLSASGFIIDPSNKVSASLVIAVDSLIGVYRDPSTKEQLLIFPGAAVGSALPYELLLSSLPGVVLTTSAEGSSFHESVGGHQIDLDIDQASATGTIDGRSVVLPRVCGP